MRIHTLLIALCLLASGFVRPLHAYEYLGCFKDLYPASERDLPGSLLLNDDGANLITPAYCEDYCGARQFAYVGVQYGSECWCGNSYGKHGQLAESDCSTPCVGDASLKNQCGGALANSVFKVTKQYDAPAANPNDGRPLLGLVMIVKDEAHTLPNTLAPLAPFIDYYYILDTGSTDGTQDAIRKVLGPKGEIWEEPFIDYGRSRNRALDIAQQAANPPIFSLMLSADETVHHPEALRRFCETYRNSEGAMHEAYPIQLDVGWRFDSTRLSRTDKGWRYVGRVHEYLAAPDRKWRPTMRVPEAYIQFRVTDPERRGKREYKIRDILLEEIREKPTDTRASFYLARTYNVLRNHSAALAEFQRRISLGGWQEEVYESYYAIAFQREALGEPWPNILQAFLDAHAHSPDRGEPLFNIAQHYYRTDQKPLAFLYASHCASLPYPKDAVLWVQANVYNWQCLMYTGLAGLHVKGKTIEGYTALLRALQKNPGEHSMVQAKKTYESKLDKNQLQKAECMAGVAADTAACARLLNTVALPCVSSSDAPAPSLASRIASDSHTPEQSNFGLASVSDPSQAHIPASLRARYGATPSSFELQGYSAWTLILLGMLAAVILLGGLLAFSKTRTFTSLQLKLLGGKRRTGGDGSSGGEKFV